MSEDFHGRLAQALLRSGKNQGEVAAAVGITPAYLSDLKKGKKSNPRTEILTKLADVLQVTVPWLLTGGDSPANSLREESGVWENRRYARPDYRQLFDRLIATADTDWLFDRMKVLHEQSAQGDQTAKLLVDEIFQRIQDRMNNPFGESQPASPEPPQEQ